MNGGVITIKLDAGCVCASNSLRSMSGSKPLTDQQRAILVLLGGYNAHGRMLNLEEVERLQDEFDAIVARMEILVQNSSAGAART